MSRTFDMLTGSHTFAVERMTLTPCEVDTTFELADGIAVTLPDAFFDFDPVTQPMIVIDTIDPAIIGIHEFKMT